MVSCFGSGSNKEDVNMIPVGPGKLKGKSRVFLSAQSKRRSFLSKIGSPQLWTMQPYFVLGLQSWRFPRATVKRKSAEKEKKVQ